MLCHPCGRGSVILLFYHAEDQSNIASCCLLSQRIGPTTLVLSAPTGSNYPTFLRAQSDPVSAVLMHPCQKVMVVGMAASAQLAWDWIEEHRREIKIIFIHLLVSPRATYGSPQSNTVLGFSRFYKTPTL